MKVTMGSKNIVYEKNIMKIIATNVAKYRKEKHLTQEEVAKRADIGFDFYRHFEAGKGSIGISVYNLYRISVALEVEMGCLFNED